MIAEVSPAASSLCEYYNRQTILLREREKYITNHAKLNHKQIGYEYCQK